MPAANRKPESFFGEDEQVNTYLLMGIKLRIAREVLGMTQPDMARKVGMSLPEYKKIEEAQHAPDSEKTLKMVRGGLKGFKPYDARTKIAAEVVELLLPRHPEGN